jgi:hypothetical protein
MLLAARFGNELLGAATSQNESALAGGHSFKLTVATTLVARWFTKTQKTIDQRTTNAQIPTHPKM